MLQHIHVRLVYGSHTGRVQVDIVSRGPRRVRYVSILPGCPLDVLDNPLAQRLMQRAVESKAALVLERRAGRYGSFLKLVDLLQVDLGKPRRYPHTWGAPESANNVIELGGEDDSVYIILSSQCLDRYILRRYWLLVSLFPSV